MAAQDLGDPIQNAMESNNYTQAFLTAKSEAERGDAKAQGDLGLMYEKGLGTDVDPKKAAYWLARGAHRGDASAENNLGALFFHGEAVIQDYAQARQWFEKAADQGLASAQCNLGLIYGAGLGVPKDYAKALSYYQKAADQDDVDAQVNLGMMISLGEGTEQDYKTAYFWFYRALQHPFTDEDKKNEVRDDIQWLEKHMDPKDVETARNKAMRLKPVNPQPSRDSSPLSAQ